MNAECALEPEARRPLNHGTEFVLVGEIGNRPDKADRGDAGPAAGYDGHHVWDIKPIGIDGHAHRNRKILGADDHGAHARVGGSDLVHVVKPLGILDHGDQPGVPRRQAGLDFTLVQDFGDRTNHRAVWHLRQRDRLDRGANAGLDVPHHQAPGAIDTHDHVVARGGGPVGQCTDAPARAFLEIRRNAVLEIELDGVGRAPHGAFEESVARGRDKQHGAPAKRA